MKQVKLGPLYYDYDRRYPPRLRIEPGERVQVETEDAFTAQIRGEGDRRDKTAQPRSNPQTGPILVQGAMPGDTLAVKIESIEPSIGQCATYTTNPKQLRQWLGDDCPHGSHVCPIKDGKIHWSSQVTIPYQPMLGCIAHDGVKVWVRTAREADIEVIVSEKSGLSEPVASARGRSKSADDFTAVLQVSGLKKNTTYHYGLGVNGAKPADAGTFRTVHPPGSGLALRLAFGGGAGYTPQDHECRTRVRDEGGRVGRARGGERPLRRRGDRKAQETDGPHDSHSRSALSQHVEDVERAGRRCQRAVSQRRSSAGISRSYLIGEPRPVRSRAVSPTAVLPR